MSKDNGFLQLRRGIWEHVKDGRMTLAEQSVHAYISSQADTRTGVWYGSAGALAGELSISPRAARKFLERLSRGGYIKRFPVPGKHTCYPILVHKFMLSNGEHRGEQLNAAASTSSVDLRYFAGEHVGEQEGEHVASQKILDTREEIKREEKPNYVPAALVVPVDLWLSFVEMRKKIRKPLTGRAGDMIAAKLRWFGEHGGNPTEILSQSIMNSWAGVFPVKENSNGHTESFEERRQRKSAEAIGAVRGRVDEILRKVEPAPRLESGQQSANSGLRRGPN